MDQPVSFGRGLDELQDELASSPRETGHRLGAEVTLSTDVDEVIGGLISQTEHGILENWDAHRSQGVFDQVIVAFWLSSCHAPAGCRPDSIAGVP
jgi:hypothetical protein